MLKCCEGLLSGYWCILGGVCFYFLRDYIKQHCLMCLIREHGMKLQSRLRCKSAVLFKELFQQEVRSIPAAEVLKQLYLEVFRGFTRGQNALNVLTMPPKTDMKWSSSEDVMNDSWSLISAVYNTCWQEFGVGFTFQLFFALKSLVNFTINYKETSFALD